MIFTTYNFYVFTLCLLDKERKVYEYVVRHFLACLSKDAEGEETIVNIDINGEKVIVYLCTECIIFI